jgi:hypothetical protein
MNSIEDIAAKNAPLHKSGKRSAKTVLAGSG